MKKAKFLQDAKLDPSRYYRSPSDIIRDRRLTNNDRFEILGAWEREARERGERAGFVPEEAQEVQELRRVREELERAADALGTRDPALGRAEDQV